MTFSEALVALKDGKKVRRNLWVVEDGYPKAHIFLDKEDIIFHFEPGREIREYKLNTRQILADDWEIGGYKTPTKENLRDMKLNKLLNF